MKIKFKFFSFLFFLSIFKNLFSYEIIRDPIFEDYFINIASELKLNQINTYLIKNNSANAFVIDSNIYITTGLLEIINTEDTLKAIYLHEYGHVIKNHFKSKKIKIQQSKYESTLFNLLSVGLAVIIGDSSLGIGTSVSLNSKLVNEISKHSITSEVEADNFMIENIKKNKINTSELTIFLNELYEPNNYFRTHPRNEERVNNLTKINFKKKENSIIFDWIKSKYSNNSNNKDFNIFFKNLDKGIFNQQERFDRIQKEIIQYEAFKKGFFIDDWENQFHNLLMANNNSFLKIEYINYLLDNNLETKYQIIENLKFDKKLMNEYFYYYLYGKYYNKIGKISLSNFYLCQFYSAINFKYKADFFCPKYDIKDIPTLDKSYALFK